MQMEDGGCCFVSWFNAGRDWRGWWWCVPARALDRHCVCCLLDFLHIYIPYLLSSLLKAIINSETIFSVVEGSN